ncbi:unnamed protein product [Rhizophagus irregularis]|nr:unnamed protein product [Rhizophagus irregularis]CAB5395429.1 unnamed protein product [Rhizophagus irregularis]
MYLYLTGNPNALPNWEFKNNAPIDILMRDNNRVSYLLQSATILSEIELFYLLPNQRRWKTWFPDVIYYHANIDKTRREIKEINKDGISRNN